VSNSDNKRSVLEKDVSVVGEAWAESPYYDDAERWTFLFWNPETDFRQLFDRLDLTTVVELACGHGRHTENVVDRAGNIVVIDIFESNIQFCKQRLGHNRNISFIKGSGSTFDFVESDSTTAIFCYDAMVHFSPEMVKSYLADTARILKPGGMALFHHSNYAAPLGQHYGLNPHSRNHMTILLFEAYANAAGLDVVENKAIPWGGIESLDAISLVSKPR
jgi:SAM-dependent methyltransferase